VGVLHTSSGGKGLILGRPSIVGSADCPIVCRRLEKGGIEGVGRGSTPTLYCRAYLCYTSSSILAQIVKAVGFQDEYGSNDLGEWLNDTAEGFRQEWKSN